MNCSGGSVSGRLLREATATAHLPVTVPELANLVDHQDVQSERGRVLFGELADAEGGGALFDALDVLVLGARAVETEVAQDAGELVGRELGGDCDA